MVIRDNEMNELLEDFAAKAQIEAEWATPQGLEWFGAFKQRYAELIVKECAKFTDHTEELYRHFGVEE